MLSLQVTGGIRSGIALLSSLPEHLKFPFYLWLEILLVPIWLPTQFA